jgi:hypothetical protein
VKNNFNAFYGALAWRPDDSLRVDWNISYDDYYDFNVTHGWNRATQQSVDNRQYYKGRATPIIQNGSAFWSPVFESGAANSKVIGWQNRQKNDKNQYIAVGQFKQHLYLIQQQIRLERFEVGSMIHLYLVMDWLN